MPLRLVITRDQLAYNRYIAFCAILRQSPMTFDVWLRESERIPGRWDQLNVMGRSVSSLTAVRGRG